MTLIVSCIEELEQDAVRSRWMKETDAAAVDAGKFWGSQRRRTHRGCSYHDSSIEITTLLVSAGPRHTSYCKRHDTLA